MNPTVPTLRGNLAAPQRRELLALIAERPHLTAGQLARIFAARTGRAICDSTVVRARAVGFRPGPDWGRRHLTAGERAILERLCHQGAPRFSRSEIARRFEAAAGRPLHRTSVGKFLARHFEDSRPRRRGAKGVPG